jgi:4-aminobutyrate aminotransferase-like enzyme
LACAAVLATLDEFDSGNVLQHARSLTGVFVEGLNRLKLTGLVAKVRGEGLVFGIECAEYQGRDSKQIAAEIVKCAYLGNGGGEGIHLLGPLAGNVIRISPPLTITEEQARASLALLYELAAGLERRLAGSRAAPVAIEAR